MNHIEVKNIKTCYDYFEHYWIIDGKPITFYLDEYIKWVQELNWEFEAEEYEIAVEQYRELRRLEEWKDKNA